MANLTCFVGVLIFVLRSNMRCGCIWMIRRGRLIFLRIRFISKSCFNFLYKNSKNEIDSQQGGISFEHNCIFVWFNFLNTTSKYDHFSPVWNIGLELIQFTLALQYTILIIFEKSISEFIPNPTNVQVLFEIVSSDKDWIQIILDSV